MDAHEDVLDTYLDALLAGLRGTAHDVRRALAESEAHLRERIDDLVVQGRSPADATALAIAAFGDVAEIAAAFNRAHRRQTARALLPAAVFQASRLGAVGLIAIGISGLVAWLATSVSSTSAVFGNSPGTRFDAASCAHYLAVQQAASSCAQAALLEGRDDLIFQRSGAGIVGVLLLLSTMYWQRRSFRRNGPAQPVPTSLLGAAALVGVTVFAAVGVGLTGYGVDRAVTTSGSGQWLISGTIALAIAAGYLGVLWRHIGRTVPL